MKGLVKAALFVVSTCLVAGPSQGVEPIPAEAFAKVPDIQSVSMSSDGRHLVAIIASPGSDHQETALATWDLADFEAGPTITPSGDRMKFIAADALKAGKVLVVARQEWTGQLGGCGEGKTTGATRTFVTKAYLTDSGHSTFGEAFADNTRRIGVSESIQRCLEIAGTASLLNRLPLDPDHVVVQQLNQATLSANIYKYNLRTGATELLVRAGGRSSPGLLSSRDGSVLTRVELEPAGANDYVQKILMRDPQSDEFVAQPALQSRLAERKTVSIAGVDEASGKFYVLTDLFSDRVEAWMYDPATRAFDAEALVAHPQYGVAGLILGSQPSNFNQVLGFVVDGPDREVVYVDPDMKAIEAGLEQAYPGLRISILDYNDDKSRILFSTSSHRQAPAYYLLSDRKDVALVGAQRPWIDPSLIGEQKWVSYKARDGRAIPAILDLPAGWTAADGPLPAIVHPHGGPWARDYTGWDASGWVPFLTSRGYAVLRPQYRGSAGLGRDLWMAGDAQWGLAMQDDLDDGAAWLVSEGIAAADRLAIFGYSYGGFAAAAAVVRETGPFQCAISGAPVTNLGRLGTAWSDNRLQRILQGQTVKGMDPMLNAASARLPVLLYVGDRDVRTPSFHARDFYEAVRDKVPARFELIADMPHSMPWYPRHQTQTLGLIEDYLANQCGPGGL